MAVYSLSFSFSLLFFFFSSPCFTVLKSRIATEIQASRKRMEMKDTKKNNNNKNKKKKKDSDLKRMLQMHELVLRNQNGDQRNDFPSVSQCKLVVAEIHRCYSFKMNIQKKKR